MAPTVIPDEGGVGKRNSDATAGSATAAQPSGQKGIRAFFGKNSSTPPPSSRGNKAMRKTGTTPQRAVDEALAHDNAEMSEAPQGLINQPPSADDVSMSSFDREVEGISRNLDSSLANAEQTVGGDNLPTSSQDGNESNPIPPAQGGGGDPTGAGQGGSATATSTGASSINWEVGKAPPPAATQAGSNPNSLNSSLRGSSLSRAAKRWTPGTAQRKERSRGAANKTASFSAPTKFNQKKVGGGLPKSTNKRANTSTDEVVEVFKHRFIARITIRLPHCNSVQQMALTILAGVLGILQRRDPATVFIKGESDITARDLRELPSDWIDFMDDWSDWEDPPKAFKNNIREGKTRRVTGSVVFGCNWDPHDLIRKCELAICERGSHGGSVDQFVYKEIQVVHTSQNCILFGVPNNIDRGACAALLRKLMKQAQPKLTAKNPGKYPPSRYGGDLPPFEVRRDWVKNAGWSKYDEDEDLPGWAKSALQVEVAREHEPVIEACLLYLKNTGLFKKTFGDFAWVAINPGHDASGLEQSNLGTMLDRHSAVQLCLGRTPMKGLLDADKEVLLHMELDAEGRERQPVMRSVRQILAHQRHDGVKLWQMIALRHDGSYEGFYTNGKGCDGHEDKASKFGGALGAHLRFLCLGKGVSPESVDLLLSKCFSTAARREAAEAKFIKGEVFTARQASFQADLDAMENSWLDIAKGMPRLKRIEYQRNKERSAAAATATKLPSAMSPNDPAAYNFNDANSLTSVIHNANATVHTTAETATLGPTIYQPNEDDSSFRSTADGAFEDYDTEEEGGGTYNFSGMENVTGAGHQPGEDAAMEDSMGTAFNPRPGEKTPAATEGASQNDGKAQEEEKGEEEESVESMTGKVISSRDGKESEQHEEMDWDNKRKVAELANKLRRQRNLEMMEKTEQAAEKKAAAAPSTTPYKDVLEKNLQQAGNSTHEEEEITFFDTHTVDETNSVQRHQQPTSAQGQHDKGVGEVEENPSSTGRGVGGSHPADDHMPG